MLPFNADNLQDDDVPPPPADVNDTDEAGEEVAPTLSESAVEALDHLTERHDTTDHQVDDTAVAPATTDSA